MVEIKDSVIIEREKDFVADEVSFINFVVSDYTNPLAPTPNEYAKTEYDETTYTLCNQMRAKLLDEATGKGLTGKDKGTYINLQVDPFKLERKGQRDQVVQTRTKELMTEIPEGEKNLKKLSSLKTTINDGILVQDFAIQVLNVHPENIALLATQADAN